MSKLRERIPFNVGDEVVFSMANGKTVTGVVECLCLDWVWKLRVTKRADVAKEAEEFLRKECPEGEN